MGKALLTLTGSALLLSACQSPSEERKVSDSRVFSLDSFFNAETSRLQQLDPPILKTVQKDREEEQKLVKIANWKDELAAFRSADISKNFDPTLYRIKDTDCTTTYTANKKGLAVQRLMIERTIDHQVKHIQIDRTTDNMLYKGSEKLDYYPDSLYRIVKDQDVLALKPRHYQIQGIFKK